MNQEDKIKATDERIHIAVKKCSTDLQTALSEVDEAFISIDAPWIEYCVRETIFRWHLLARRKERNVLHKIMNIFRKGF